MGSDVNRFDGEHSMNIVWKIALTLAVTSLCLVSTFLAAGSLPPCGQTPAGGRPETVLLFTSFRDNGQDGLHLMWSEDGYAWQVLGSDRSFLTPQVGGKLMRDPQIAVGPDGAYHLVWTTAWEKYGVGYASSRDLIHWSDQKLLDVMKNEPETRNVWAPELFFDGGKNQFLLFWSSTIPGRFPETEKSGDGGRNHRIYFATTRDFRELASARLFYNPGFNCIDATIVQDGQRFLMILKDETRYPPAKNLRVASAPAPDGPYGPASMPITGDYWAEGPTAIRIGDRCFVYFDRYREGRYGLVTSQDLVSWIDETERLQCPKGHRHGSVLRIPRALLAGLQATP
jgi:hypothetical protein